MTKKLKVGVLGCGMISYDHLTAWAREKRAEVVAVCDPDGKRAQARADEFGIETVLTSPEALMTMGDLDALDIITPRQTHADLILAAADRGLPVLCEKPICPTYDEAHSLVAAIAGRTRVMVNENWRFRPYFRQIKTMIDAGVFGEITLCRIALTRSSLLPDENGSVPSLRRQPFVAREERLVIAESLIHELDTMRYLLGECRVEASFLSRSSPSVIGEDTAVIVMKGTADLPIIVTGTMVAAGYAYRAGDRMEIYGTRTSAILEDGSLRFQGACAADYEYDENDARQVSFDSSISHFVDCLLTGSEFETDINDQLKTMALVEKAYETGGMTTLRIDPLVAVTQSGIAL